MDFIWNKVTEWLKEMMVGGIMGNLEGLFTKVNEEVANIAGQVVVFTMNYERAIE